MTLLTYIPTIDAYNIDGHRLNYLSVDQIVHMYPSVLVDFLNCTYNNALDIQTTLKEQERPLFIYIVDDTVSYLY